jgi:hypothetical protein
VLYPAELPVLIFDFVIEFPLTSVFLIAAARLLICDGLLLAPLIDARDRLPHPGAKVKQPFTTPRRRSPARVRQAGLKAAVAAMI